MAMKRNVQEQAQTEQPAVGIEAKIEEARLAEKIAKANAEGEAEAEAEAVAAAEASVKSMTAIKPAPAPAKTNSAIVKILDDVENYFPVEFGVLPRLKASNGNLIDGDDNLLGDAIDLQVVSWNRNFVAGPCSNNAPTDLVKYSLDRDAFADGSGTLDDHINELKDAGYPDACIKEYYEVVAELVKAAKPTELIGELVQLQLSPTSVKEFEKYRLQTSFKIARGRLSEEQGSFVKASAVVVSAKGNTWTKMTFKPTESA